MGQELRSQPGSLTRDAWLKALGEAAQPTDPDALTAQEIAAMLGMHHKVVGVYIRRLIAEGRAQQTCKMIQTTAGYTRRVPAYRLLDVPSRKRR